MSVSEANPSELEVLRQRNTELEEKMVELNMWRRLALLNDKKITELKDQSANLDLASHWIYRIWLRDLASRWIYRIWLRVGYIGFSFRLGVGYMDFGFRFLGFGHMDEFRSFDFWFLDLRWISAVISPWTLGFHFGFLVRFSFGLLLNG
ncbi:hypothetical protein RhiirB3_531811 [Rhizophagus irregularis]|nr:hypothetical protein RhiirB3_531811 [Rhizophagus irregularis]